MNFSAHRKITRAALEILSRKQGLPIPADQIVYGSTYPDEVGDKRVQGSGEEIAGLAIAAFDHFCVLQDESRRARDSRFRGYCMLLDPSMKDVDKLIPHSDVVWIGGWKHGPLNASRHPTAELLDVLKTSGSSRAFDEMTFSSGAAVGEWCGLGRDPGAIGCVCHLLEDMIPHHARGWLLRGHSSWESNQEEYVDRCDLHALKLPWVPAKLGIRQRIERMAYISSRMGVEETRKAFERSTAFALANVIAYLKQTLAVRG